MVKKTKIIKKTVIFAGYECNNQCVFCINYEKRNLPPRTTEEIKNELIDARKRGSIYAEFIGGEFTIRQDALQLIKFAKTIGFKTINMATNGRVPSYREYAKNIIDAGLTDIIFSIHGHNSKLHDELTQAPGSFNQLMKGLDNFKKLKFKNIGANTTIVKQNYKFLPKIGQLISDLGIRNTEFIFVDPNYGGAKVNFNELVPRISKIAPYVRKCLDIGREYPHWHIRYVPLCYFKEYLNQVSEIDEVKKFKTEHIAADFKNYSVETSRAEVGRIKTRKCDKCRLKDVCEGIWKEYVKHYGDDELKSVLKI